MAWLAAAVLRGWGLKATPILVGTGLRERVSSLLPMTLLFNHAVVEVEVGGATRWFDLTLRSQGGDFQTQPVGLFNVGLPVDVLAESLQAQPGPLWPNLLAVHETVYLDTRMGEPSVVEQRVWTEGFQAERLRRTWLEQGPEKYSEERLKAARVCLGKVTRIGAIQSRDDREKR